MGMGIYLEVNVTYCQCHIETDIKNTWIHFSFVNLKHQITLLFTADIRKLNHKFDKEFDSSYTYMNWAGDFF